MRSESYTYALKSLRRLSTECLYSRISLGSRLRTNGMYHELVHGYHSIAFYGNNISIHPINTNGVDFSLVINSIFIRKSALRTYDELTMNAVVSENASTIPECLTTTAAV
jgi:hypothetical protein